MILCASPLEQYKSYKTEIDVVIANVLMSGCYINGEEVKSFEKEFAAYCSAKHAVGVANGTDAVRIALQAAGVRPGDEVITVSHTAVATVAAIIMAGAEPILVDVDPLTYTIDPERVAAALTEKTRAIVAVHLYGQAADLVALKVLCRLHNLLLVEDCAQAHGARQNGVRVGSMGDIAAFSFYPTKNLGAIGDGGAVVTNNDGFARRARLLREYGEFAGANSRLDELQAAILRVKLGYLDRDNAARVRIAAYYNEALQGLSLETPAIAKGNSHVYHLYVIRLSGVVLRGEVISRLLESGIRAGVHYSQPVHLNPVYRNRIKISGAMTQTEALVCDILSLPIYPELRLEQCGFIVNAFRSSFSSGGSCKSKIIC